jgi:hypothetical protein
MHGLPMKTPVPAAHRRIGAPPAFLLLCGVLMLQGVTATLAPISPFAFFVNGIRPQPWPSSCTRRRTRSWPRAATGLGVTAVLIGGSPIVLAASPP